MISALPSRPSSPPRWRRRPLALALAALLALVACGSDGSASADTTTTTEATSTEGDSTTSTEADTTTTPDDDAASPAAPVAEPGTHAVGRIETTVVDDSRPTAAQNGEAEKPERTLPTLVFYPAEGSFVAGEPATDAPALPGPWPLVVFSHGLGGDGPSYQATVEVWASAGYVVVAPTYPLTSLATPGGPESTDLVNQPADVSFLIDWALDRPADDLLADAIDPERVGISGHSLGGFTSLAAGYNPCCVDDQVDAVAEWAGAYLPGLGGEAIQDGPPLLVVHGDADGTVPYSRADDAVEAVGAPWWLVTLVGGPHIPPYVQGLGDDYSTVTTLTTLDFFDRFLKDDPEGIDRLEAEVADAGPDVATLESDEG